MGRAFFAAGPTAERSRTVVRTLTCVPVASVGIEGGAVIEGPLSFEDTETATSNGCSSDTHFIVYGEAAGDALLTLRDAAGAMIDQFVLVIVTPTAVRFSVERGRVFAGSEASISFDLLGEAETLLEGCPETVVPGTAGDLQVRPCTDDEVRDECRTLCFRAGEAGGAVDDRLVVDVGAARGEVPIEVVPRESITGIELHSEEDGFTIRNGGLGTLLTSYHFVVPDGTVFGDVCEWTSDEPGIVEPLLDGRVGQRVGPWGASHNLAVAPRGAGTTFVRCAVPSGAQAAVRVTVAP